MAQFPCRKCRRVFWSKKKLDGHACGEIKPEKPPKIQHNRSKPKRGQHTAVTAKVRKEVDRRSMELMGTDVPVCERCGYARELTKAHMVNASQYGSGGDPRNIANLCGTHGTKGCHEWADNTAAGHDWKAAYRIRLTEYYKEIPSVTK